MITNRRLLAAALAVLVVVSGCSDDPPPGPKFTTTATLLAQAPDGRQPTTDTLQQAAEILRSRMSAMELIGAGIEVQGTGIRVSLPGKQEQRLATLARPGRLAFREVIAGPLRAGGSGGGDAEEARRLRQSKDLLAGDAKAERAATRALAVLSCDGGDDPLASAEDPTLPLVACERTPAEGGARMAYVLGPRLLDNSAIQAASAKQAVDSVGFTIMVKFTSAGRAQWSEITGRLAQEPKADGTAGQVAFVLDTAVISAPQVMQRIDGDTQISGDFTRDEAEATAGVLTTQPLPLSFGVTDLRVVRSSGG